jgi:hypothetical protein
MYSYKILQSLSLNLERKTSARTCRCTWPSVGHLFGGATRIFEHPSYWLYYRIKPRNAFVTFLFLHSPLVIVGNVAA